MDYLIRSHLPRNFRFPSPPWPRHFPFLYCSQSIFTFTTVITFSTAINYSFYISSTCTSTCASLFYFTTSCTFFSDFFHCCFGVFFVVFFGVCFPLWCYLLFCRPFSYHIFNHFSIDITITISILISLTCSCSSIPPMREAREGEAGHSLPWYQGWHPWNLVPLPHSLTCCMV